jgi:hypothetical protein
VLIGVEKKIILRLKMEVGNISYRNYHPCLTCRLEVILGHSGQTFLLVDEEIKNKGLFM